MNKKELSTHIKNLKMKIKNLEDRIMYAVERRNYLEKLIDQATIESTFPFMVIPFLNRQVRLNDQSIAALNDELESSKLHLLSLRVQHLENESKG